MREVGKLIGRERRQQGPQRDHAVLVHVVLVHVVRWYSARCR